MHKDLIEYARRRYAGKTIYLKEALVKFEIICKEVGKSNFILELGCGDGTLTKMMRRYNEVVPIDNEIDLQKDNLPFLADAFDTVVASELIEHIWDCDRLLKEIHRVLTPKGRLILSTPNLLSLGRRLMMLLGRNPYVENFLYPWDAGHLKHFTRKDFVYLLQNNNFTVKKLITDVIVFIPPHIYSVMLGKLFPQFGRSIIAVCEADRCKIGIK